MKEALTPLNQLKSVLCNPEGKCCIAGSDEDRAIVDRALKALAQPAQEPAVYIRKDQLQKAMQYAMLCEVTSEPRQDRVRIYTAPLAAQPAQEPVLRDEQGRPMTYWGGKATPPAAQEPDELTIAYMSGLYDGKKKRPWVGLTDVERSQLVTLHHGWNEYGQAIEAALRSKNYG
jgi:hypothetical protein